MTSDLSPGKRDTTRQGDGAWRRCLLADVSREVTVGHVGPMAHEYVPIGIPFIRSQDIAPSRIRLDDVKYISMAFHERLRKSSLRPGDVVIVRTGRPGTAAVVPENLPVANCADLVIVRPGEELDARFLAYYINAAAKNYVAAHLVGAVQQHFNVGSAKAIGLLLPEIAEQRRIVRVLGAVDDKIDSNRRLAELLEATAATLFRARFVDFVGVDEVEESEIGRLPRDWRAGSLTDLARFVNGKAFTKHANGCGRPIIRIRELNDGVDHGTPHSDIEIGEDFIAGFDDILFAWSGSLGVYRWPGDESLINQHIFKVIPDGWPAWFVFAWIEAHMAEFRGVARDKATTIGHIQRRHLDESRLPLPTMEAIAEADAVVGPLDRHRAGLVCESRTLSLVRDALLPKLIAGQIRVPDTADPGEMIEPAANAIAAAS